MKSLFEKDEIQLDISRRTRVIVREKIGSFESDPYIQIKLIYRSRIKGKSYSYELIDSEDIESLIRINTEEGQYYLENQLLTEVYYQYHKFLKEHVEIHETNSVEVENISTVKKSTHKQQILILHYLGFLDKIESLHITQEKKAELLSIILNRGSKNTKTFFTNIKLVMENEDIHTAKTPKNLDFVENLFIELGLQELAQKVQDDKKRILLT